MTYPANWSELARGIKDECNWQCVRCGHPHDPDTRHVLTVHHLDGDPTNNRWWNLLPLCQRCHLSVQARVKLIRPWVMLPHSEWFKPYVAGWYAHRYLGEEVSRLEVASRLDEFLTLERAYLGVPS